MSKKEKPNVPAMIVVAIFFVALFYMGKSCLSSSPEEEVENEASLQRYKAYKECVKGVLNNPNSADFETMVERIKYNDTTELFIGKVEAANGLGMKVKKGFKTLVAYSPTQKKCYCQGTEILD